MPVDSTLMHVSETWTTHARQEKRLYSFRLRSIRRILGISWQDRVGSVMSTAWGVVSSQKTLFVKSENLEGEPKATNS